ncbi:MAG: ATP-dependent DNA ligase [Promethearchaeota archaeon]
MELCQYYQRLEKTAKRLEMIDIFSELLKKLGETSDPITIEIVVYLTQGKLYPDWTGKPEIGIAEKMAVNAIAIALGLSDKRVLSVVHKTGDIGSACEQLLDEKRQKSLLHSPLTISQVYESLIKIASAQGAGSSDFRIRSLAGLISAAQPLEARYLLRTITGALRLGIAEMTVLDALAVAFTSGKEQRPAIERAYNLTSDLGFIARIMAKEGIVGIEHVKVTIGKPIRMMAAQKLSTPEEIVEKLEGYCAAEWKLDGERMQIHKVDDEIAIFSRRLERITHMYPDIAALARKYLKANQCIVEGECVAIDAQNPKKLLPFQMLMRRRRKYRVKEMIKSIPVALFLFDCLYVDGKDTTQEPYTERRIQLEKILKPSDRISLVPMQKATTPAIIEKVFRQALDNGCEGIIAKSTSPESIYRAGARSWLWVKLKESYQAQAIGPVDLVVVGAFWGRGRRAKTYGALLAAVRDEESGEFKTVCKVGTGFSDEELEKLPNRFQPYLIANKDPLVDSKMKADVWFQPAIVFQVVGDEITRSPVHTCAFNQIAQNEGLAIRFPRFDGTWRMDKSPEEATSVSDILVAYKAQTKIQESRT